MSTITQIQSTDLITNSRTVINTNFSNLNTDKIETSYLDTDTTLSANSDSKIATQRAVKTYVDAGGNVNASTTTKGIVEEATDAEVLARTTTGGTGARLFINPSSVGQFIKFGGTGADGVLSITTGTTNIDLAGGRVVIKNYSSISITGTGALTFTNPHASGTCIVLKSSGAVTLTSSATRAIDVRSLGASSGAGGLTQAAAGGGGTIGMTKVGTISSGSGGSGTTGGALGAAQSPVIFTASFLPKNIYEVAGAGGAGGSASDVGGGLHSAGGDGGRGGGALYIECAGAYNVTGTIDASGGAGVAGGSGSNRGGGGGGGGGGGSIIALYNSLTANSGTYTVAGGAAGGGGTGSGGGTSAGAGGGAGGSITAGTAGGNASVNTGGAGGTGGTGYSLVALNTEFS